MRAFTSRADQAASCFLLILDIIDSHLRPSPSISFSSSLEITSDIISMPRRLKRFAQRRKRVAILAFS